MSTVVRDLRNSPSADPWRQRVDAGDWDAITAEIDEYGGALLPQLLTAGETARIRSLYTDDGLFRSTINMGRHRFGEGEYRYFKAPYPEPVERLKQALYPGCCPSPATGGPGSAVPPRGRTRSTSGCGCATTPGR